MRGIKNFLAATALAVLTFTANVASASTVTSFPASEDVYCDEGTLLGTITVTQYHADNPGVPLTGGPIGATMEAKFVQSDTDCNLNLHWIQAIVGGTGTIGQNLGGTLPYLDPYKRDDALPYYWTEPENNSVPDGKIAAGDPSGSHFYDAPSQGYNNGNSINFETALVAVDCNDPNKLYWLAGFTWGYSIAGNVSTINAFNWLGNYSADMNTAVTNFDGTQNYLGDANDTMANNDGFAAGSKWNFAEGCPECCCVPLPTSASMTFAGLLGLGILSIARSKLKTAA